MKRPASMPAAQVLLALTLLTFLEFPAAPHLCAEDSWRIAQSQQLSEPAPGMKLFRFTAENGESRATLHVALFSGRHFDFRVIDRPDKNGPRLARTIAESHNQAVLGINGGYFDPAFQPLGWVVSQGVELSPPRRAGLITGVLLAGGRRPQLLRMSELKAETRAIEALQAGPFLVDRGRPVVGLNRVKRAARTFVGTDGTNTWIVGVAFSPTLAEAGSLLATPDLIESFKPQRVLNLDGGRSTGFIALQPDGQPAVVIEEISSVRNFLSVIPRR